MKHIELNNEMVKKKDGFYQLEKDKEALAVYLEHVKENTVDLGTPMERIQYLVANDYYYDVLQDYLDEEIESVIACCNQFDFQFQSYMAASKFYSDYALRTNDKKKFLETYAERVAIVALYLADGFIDKALFFAEQMMKQNYQPATPTFLNSGKSRRGELVSCFLLEMGDNLNSINYNLSVAKQLSKIGGGVAVNLSKLRGRGETIKEIEGAASGVLPVMKLMEDSFAYVDQLGQRKGAGAAYLNIFHWDVLEFLDSKKINADEKSRIQTLSIGLIVPRKFYELAEENKDMYVFAPYTVFKAYGVELDDMDMEEMYEELLTNEKVMKKKLPMSARSLLSEEIGRIQLESGYPYIMNKTNANEQNPLKNIGQIKMSNLCTEILQIQETSEIADYGKGDIIKRDISCNLGSMNIVNVMETKQLKEAVFAGMDMLTAVSNLSKVENAPGVRKANDELHSVGLGVMNLHGFLAKNGIPYESEEAKDFASTFFMMVNFYSITRSMQTAKELNATFKGFEHTDYANGSYFKMYEKDFSPTTDKVKGLFDGITIPTPTDWENLKKDVMVFGLFNSYRLTVAPTQSISYVQNATSGVMPIVDKVETRVNGNSTTYYPMPFLSPATFWMYKSAYDMDQLRVIDLISVIQPHVDQGISCILHVNSDISTRTLGRYYYYAQKKGLKSLYYTRTRKLDVGECESCSV